MPAHFPHAAQTLCFTRAVIIPGSSGRAESIFLPTRSIHWPTPSSALSASPSRLHSSPRSPLGAYSCAGLKLSRSFSSFVRGMRTNISAAAALSAIAAIVCGFGEMTALIPQMQMNAADIPS